MRGETRLGNFTHIPKPTCVGLLGGNSGGMLPAARRGVFILFEGVDRCGKTTQANLLVKSLQDAGKPTEFMRFPGAFSPARAFRKVCVVFTSC